MIKCDKCDVALTMVRVHKNKAYCDTIPPKRNIGSYAAYAHRLCRCCVQSAAADLQLQGLAGVGCAG